MCNVSVWIKKEKQRYIEKRDKEKRGKNRLLLLPNKNRTSKHKNAHALLNNKLKKIIF